MEETLPAALAALLRRQLARRVAKREGAARSGNEKVTMLGYLVHNEHVTRELEESGESAEAGGGAGKDGSTAKAEA